MPQPYDRTDPRHANRVIWDKSHADDPNWRGWDDDHDLPTAPLLAMVFGGLLLLILGGWKAIELLIEWGAALLN